MGFSGIDLSFFLRHRFRDLIFYLHFSTDFQTVEQKRFSKKFFLIESLGPGFPV